MKTCPFCITDIDDRATVCPNCHRDQPGRETAKAVAGSNKAFWYGAAFFVGGLVMLLVFPPVGFLFIGVGVIAGIISGVQNLRATVLDAGSRRWSKAEVLTAKICLGVVAGFFVVSFVAVSFTMLYSTIAPAKRNSEAVTPFSKSASDQKAADCTANEKRILLALKSYSLDHGGGFPNSLLELTPQYMERIPVCSVGGEYDYHGTPAIAKARGSLMLNCCRSEHNHLYTTADIDRMK